MYRLCSCSDKIIWLWFFVPFFFLFFFFVCFLFHWKSTQGPYNLSLYFSTYEFNCWMMWGWYWGPVSLRMILFVIKYNSAFEWLQNLSALDWRRAEVTSSVYLVFCLHHLDGLTSEKIECICRIYPCISVPSFSSYFISLLYWA